MLILMQRLPAGQTAETVKVKGDGTKENYSMEEMSDGGNDIRAV